MSTALGRLLVAASLILCLAGFEMPSQCAPAPVAVKHSLWRVDGPGTTVYLLGAIHVLKKENYPLPRLFENTFSNCAVAVFETDLEALEQPAAQQELLSKGRLPEGQTLRQVLPAALYSNFVQHVDNATLPTEAFETLKPAMAAMTVEVIDLQRLGFDFQYGLDRHFFQEARRAGKTIVPLETVDFQINLITEMPPKQGIELLKATLEDVENTPKVAAEMLRAWETGDGPALHKLLNYGMRDAPELYRRLLTERNRTWVPKIEELLRGSKRAIVIVGAGHLVGPDGIVELLRAKHYRVAQE